MKALLLFIVLILAAVGCSPPKAPVVKRVPSYDQIDERFLKEVFVPNYTGSKSQLSNSVIQLHEHWAEFRDFMQQVEAGKIPVTQNIKGDWSSGVQLDDGWMGAFYLDRLGVVLDFQKHKDQNLVYGFRFSTNGTLINSETMDDSFMFDEHGKVIEYLHN